MRVAVVSESAWTVRDHGVHTAFVQQVNALRRLGHCVAVNNLRGCYEADLTIVHSPGPVSLLALRATRGLGVAMAHVTPETLSDSLRGEAMWSTAATRWLRQLYRAADVTVAVSPTTAIELQRIGVARQRIVSARLGIDPPASCSDRATTRRYGPKLVLGVGQLQPRKGIAEFARVAAALPHYRFVWAGGRPFGALTSGGFAGKVLRRLAIRNLTFTGRVTESALQALYRQADAFLFLSRQENFGQVVVEAAHHRLPLVLSRIAAFEDHFESGAVLVDLDEAAARLSEVVESRTITADSAERSRQLSARFMATDAVADLLGQLRTAV